MLWGVALWHGILDGRRFKVGCSAGGGHACVADVLPFKFPRAVITAKSCGPLPWGGLVTQETKMPRLVGYGRAALLRPLVMLIYAYLLELGRLAWISRASFPLRRRDERRPRTSPGVLAGVTGLGSARYALALYSILTFAADSIA